MKRLLACLVLCASYSASAQDDNCTVLGVQELSSLYSELSASIDTIVAALEISAAAQQPRTISELSLCTTGSSNGSFRSVQQLAEIQFCVNDKLADGWQPLGPIVLQGNSGAILTFVKYAED